MPVSLSILIARRLRISGCSYAVGLIANRNFAAPRRSRSLAVGGLNDITSRETMWRRYDGDEWAAFDSLPVTVRRRLTEHAYDPWSVNALMLWHSFRRKHACSKRGTNTLLRYLDECEKLERTAFAATHLRIHRHVLPHVAAGASVLRYANGQYDQQGPFTSTVNVGDFHV